MLKANGRWNLCRCANLHSIKFGIALLAISLLACVNGFGQATFYSSATGNWSNSGTWTINSGSDADGVPDANDDVIVRGGFTVTVNANSSCNTLQIGGIAGAPLNNSGVVNF